MDTENDAVTFEVWMPLGRTWANNYDIQWDIDTDGGWGYTFTQDVECPCPPHATPHQNEADWKACYQSDSWSEDNDSCRGQGELIDTNPYTGGSSAPIGVSPPASEPLSQ